MWLFTTYRKNFDFAFYIIYKLLHIVIVVLEGYYVKRGMGKSNRSSSALGYFVQEHLEKGQTAIMNFIHIISNLNLEFFIWRIKDVIEYSFTFENTNLSRSRTRRGSSTTTSSSLSSSRSNGGRDFRCIHSIKYYLERNQSKGFEKINCIRIYRELAHVYPSYYCCIGD